MKRPVSSPLSYGACVNRTTVRTKKAIQRLLPQDGFLHWWKQSVSLRGVRPLVNSLAHDQSLQLRHAQVHDSSDHEQDEGTGHNQVKVKDLSAIDD